MQIQLSAELSKQRKMTARVAALMTEGSVEEVVLPECTQMKEEELLTALQPALTHRCAPRRVFSAHICLCLMRMRTLVSVLLGMLGCP